MATFIVVVAADDDLVVNAYAFVVVNKGNLLFLLLMLFRISILLVMSFLMRTILTFHCLGDVFAVAIVAVPVNRMSVTQLLIMMIFRSRCCCGWYCCS